DLATTARCPDVAGRVAVPLTRRQLNGEGGIRTLGTCEGTHALHACPCHPPCTSPHARHAPCHVPAHSQPHHRIISLSVGCISGEGGIRTPDAARAYTISSRAVSTGLTHLSGPPCLAQASRAVDASDARAGGRRHDEAHRRRAPRRVEEAIERVEQHRR